MDENREAIVENPEVGGLVQGGLLDTVVNVGVAAARTEVVTNDCREELGAVSLIETVKKATRYGGDKGLPLSALYLKPIRDWEIDLLRNKDG